MAEKIKLLGAKGPFGDNIFKNSVHNKQILKGGSYKAFENLGAATWKDPSTHFSVLSALQCFKKVWIKNENPKIIDIYIYIVTKFTK